MFARNPLAVIATRAVIFDQWQENTEHRHPTSNTKGQDDNNFCRKSKIEEIFQG